MLLGHPVGMAQHTPPTRLLGIGGPRRPRQALSVAPAIDLQGEYQFWQVYERVVRPLPGGGLRRAWLVCQKVYRDRLRFPHDTREAALARVLSVATARPSAQPNCRTSSALSAAAWRPLPSGDKRPRRESESLARNRHALMAFSWSACFWPILGRAGKDGKRWKSDDLHAL